MMLPMLLVRIIIGTVIYNTGKWLLEIGYNLFTIAIGGWNYEKFIPLKIFFWVLKFIADFIANITMRIYPICIVIILIFWIVYLIFRNIFLVGDIILAIPPFPDFIDSGLFQLIDDIIKVFGLTDEYILRKFGITGELVALYSDNVRREAIGKLFPYIPESVMKNNKYQELLQKWQIDVNKMLQKSQEQNPTTSNNDKSSSGTTTKKRSSDFHENSINAIKAATENCIISKTIPITTSMTTFEKSTTDIKNSFIKTECLSNQIQAYIAANLNDI